MMPPTLDLPNVVQMAVPFFVGCMVLEIVLGAVGKRRRYEVKDTTASLLMGTGNLASLALAGGVLGLIHATLYQYRLFDIGTAWWVFVICFLFQDFLFYWRHRLAHERRWMWASHVNHHSSQHYNLSTALRQPWTSFFTFGWVIFLPSTLVGFHPALLVFCSGVNLVYQFWIHTEEIKRFPSWIEAVMNTPSHHRVHHATNARYLDSNYAGTFIIWDRLFGTFVPEDEVEPPRYGLIHNLGTFNPVRIALHEWWAIFRDLSRARSLREVWGYSWGPPGWSPDGSRKTTRAIKAQWAQPTTEP